MKLYEIKTGKRRVNLLGVLANVNFFYKKNSISYKVKFTESSIYDLKHIAGYGINKLFGLTFGLFGVHKNSVRFGWKPKTNNTIMLYGYCYINGVRKEVEFREIKINNYYDLTISILPGKYLFKVKSLETFQTDVLEVKYEKIPKFGYVNFLYFGGTRTNPQNIWIGMEKIKAII